MTTTEIAAEHGVTRQTVHAHRKKGVFPKPVEGEGSTRPRFRADEVAAFFAANPPSPGKRTDLANRDEGAAMWSTTEPEAGPVLSRETQERLQAAIEQGAARAAIAEGLSERDADLIASASTTEVRALIDEWREQAGQ
ncbi:helix-turn-helix transcriptional regulator [Streptomyces sp. NPDC058848]|uniref:helix-turn-helix transcriptional regulator n=1 Tax=unclassified Streptomyces TaxID=2593676 RepID=UPI0036AE12CD